MSIKLQKYRRKQPQRFRTQHSYVDDMEVSDKSYLSIKQEQVQPIPETIQNSIPHGLYRESEHKSISQIFRHIQNPVKYEVMSNQTIMDEKKQLENHVKFLNDELNQMVKSKMSRIQQGLSRKLQRSKKNNSRFKYNQWDNAGIEMQVINNRKFLILLREQYEHLSTKLEKIEQYDHKIKYDNLIKQAKENVTKMRMLLFDKKRKNVLTGKKITELDKRDLHKVYYDYQQDYVAYAKKKEEYTKRIDKIIEDNAAMVNQQTNLAQKQLQLKNQAYKILKSLPTQMQEEHYKVMYDTKCRKMQLSLRKRQRDQQDFKRKYYGLLKEYEKVVENSKSLDQKLKQVKNQLESLHQNLRTKEHRIQMKQQETHNSQQAVRIWKAGNQKQESSDQSELSEQGDGFMLTELNNEKSTKRVTKKNSPRSHKQIKLPPFDHKRFHTEYDSKVPIKLPRMRTDYSSQSKDHESRLDDTTKTKDMHHQSKPTQRKERDRIEDMTENSSCRRKQQYLPEQLEQQEQTYYADDFQAESPKRK